MTAEAACVWLGYIYCLINLFKLIIFKIYYYGLIIINFMQLKIKSLSKINKSENIFNKCKNYFDRINHNL